MDIAPFTLVVRDDAGSVVRAEPLMPIFYERREPEAAAAKRPGVKAVPMPEGFAELAPTMLVKELMAHYGRSYRVIGRWLDEAGVKSMVPPPNIPPISATRHMLRTRSPSTGRRIIAFKQNAFATAPVDRPHRDDSRAGQAAEYLRRFSAVVRCDATGAYDQNGTHWRRGSTILDAAAVIDRAERNGWRPDAWKQCA